MAASFHLTYSKSKPQKIKLSSSNLTKSQNKDEEYIFAFFENKFIYLK